MSTSLQDLREKLQKTPRVRSFMVQCSQREFVVALYEWRHDIVVVVPDEVLIKMQDAWRQRLLASLGAAKGGTPSAPQGLKPWDKQDSIKLARMAELDIALKNSRTQDGHLRMYDPTNGRLVPLADLQVRGSQLTFIISTDFEHRVAAAARKAFRDLLG